jgi:hypothetical protein
MKKIILLSAAALLLAGLAGCKQEEPLATPADEITVLTVGLPQSDVKTVLGAPVDGKRKVYWTNGDCISVNGTSSSPLSGVGEQASSATFSFSGVLSLPYNILYPAAIYKNSTTVTLPSEQPWAEGGFASGTSPMACSLAASEAVATLGHLCSIVCLSVSKNSGVSASKLTRVTFSGNAGEQVCGDFTIDYSVPSLASAAPGTGSEVAVTLSQSLSESTPLDIYIVVPAGTYSSGFQVVLEDEFGRIMTKSKADATTLSVGKLAKATAFEFVPSATVSTLTIQDAVEEVLVVDPYNITGRVVDTDGKGIEGAVVSDGAQCVRTMVDGSFYMQSNTSAVKYVFVSTPSGYKPAVSGGIPRFYKALSDVTPSAGVYDCGSFVLTEVSNPDRFTLLISADPQPRQYKYTMDRIAYKSLDVCQDLYQELYDVSRSVSGHEVYGICLGDIVHEDMSLYSNYASALATLEYPTYNIIGNHDNDTEAADDDGGAATFESYFGPRNYSFNIGGIHFVMLDNLIMKLDGSSLTAYDQGLTPEIWNWLQADLATVTKDTKLMICAHSPMFKQISGSERSNTANYGPEYGALIDQFDEVHAWAGHSHVGFNFIYSNTHRHKNVQVHTLARSTGELWTNDYLSAGTPRGFTVVEVDNGEITWKFHPVTRQRGNFMGVTTGYCSAGAPAYIWRDWDYNSSGIAEMKDGSGALDERYQLHAYPRGSYGDDCVYANVFLWDEKWGTPTFTPTGGTPVPMTRVNAPGTPAITDVENIYDLATAEFNLHYKTYANKSGGSLAAMSGYSARTVGEITSLFRVPVAATPASGTVSVTDRFGNVYTRPVSW